MKFILFVAFYLIIVSPVYCQWYSSGGPNGASAHEIVKLASSLFVNTESGGIYKSTNNGDSWELSSTGIPCGKVIYDLVENNGILYASVSRGGIYSSSDQGVTWQPINKGVEVRTFYSLYANGIDIYAGSSERGVYFSPDGGHSWQERSNSISDISISSFETFQGKVYAGGRSGEPSRSLFVTTDKGQSWNPVVVPGISSNGVQSMEVKGGFMFVADDNTVFVTNNGVNWNRTSINTNASIVSMGTAGNMVYLTTSFGRYYVSHDDGASWNLVQNPNVDGFVYNLLFSGNKVIMTSDLGIYESIDDGASWVENNTGLNALQVLSFGNHNNYLFVGTEQQGVFRSSDRGNSWERVNNGLNSTLLVSSIITTNNAVYLGTGNGVYKSVNNGNSWSTVFEPGINKSARVLDYDNGVMATAVNGEGVYLSTDEGANWYLATNTGLATDVGYNSIEVVGSIIVVSTNNGSVFISKNLGVNWEDITIPGRYINTTDVQIKNNLLYAATYWGLFTSNDFGENWTLFNNERIVIEDLVIDSNTIYAATHDGVYASTGALGRWEPLCVGLGERVVNQLHINDGFLYAGTFASGVWKREKLQEGAAIADVESYVEKQLQVCVDDGPVNLYSFFDDVPENEGNWLPQLSSGSGVFNPLIDAGGTYTYSTSETCGCEMEWVVEVSVLAAAQEREEVEVSLCYDGVPVNLLKRIPNLPSSGGVWTPSLSSGTSFFNPNTDSEGLYVYQPPSSSCGVSEYHISVAVYHTDEPPVYTINVTENDINLKVHSSGDFEYSLNGVDFQLSPKFKNLPGGNYMVYGREINGCRSFQENVALVSYPKFFTPNGDGINDFWKIKGEVGQSYKLNIFNRYGKLLKALTYSENSQSLGWDGTYKGVLMPTSDYWFKIEFTDGTIKRGHFSLIR